MEEKKKMKKLVALLLAAMMLLALVACGNDPQPTPDPDPTPDPPVDTTVVDELYAAFDAAMAEQLGETPTPNGEKIGAVIISMSNQFWANMKNCYEAAAEKLGVSIDVQTGTFISKPEDKPARHRKKQFSFRNFKEDLKTFIPHPAEHPDEKAQTTSDNAAPAVESNRKTEDSSSEQSKK